MGGRRHHRDLRVILFILILWVTLTLVIHQLFPENSDQWNVIILDDDVLDSERNLFPCQLLGTCEFQNYVRDGRLSGSGRLGASRSSWSIPVEWTGDGKVSYPSGCYRQVHIWGNEMRTQGDFPCPGLPCGIRLIQDTSFITMQKSDAVLLLHRTPWDWDEMYKYRPPNQKWIFYSQESPLNTGPWVIPPPDRYMDTYDYIMTYKIKESHLYGSYGTFDTSMPSIDISNNKNWAATKSKTVVWLASNCFTAGVHWDRFTFVSVLSDFMPVSIYGKCGDVLTCPPEHNADLCAEELRKHKFYLALENSPCRQYISEKLWSNAYLNDLVPVVFGPPREDYEAVAPPNSFIHVEDFTSVKELALYLHKLDKNDHLYNRFFEWKKEGFVVATKEDWLLEPRQMCQVVDRLLVDEEASARGISKRRSSLNWEEWWRGSCRNVTFPINAI